MLSIRTCIITHNFGGTENGVHFCANSNAENHRFNPKISSKLDLGLVHWLTECRMQLQLQHTCCSMLRIQWTKIKQYSVVHILEYKCVNDAVWMRTLSEGAHHRHKWIDLVAIQVDLCQFNRAILVQCFCVGSPLVRCMALCQSSDKCQRYLARTAIRNLIATVAILIDHISPKANWWMFNWLLLVWILQKLPVNPIGTEAKMRKS